MMLLRPRSFAAVAMSLLSACGSIGVDGPTTAQARLEPVDGGSVGGVVTFYEVDAGVLVEATVTGLARGAHGFHIHEGGDCAGGAAGIGAHFNPHDAPHDRWDAADRHVGDLPMLTADASGRARLSAVTVGPSIRSGRASIVGRSVVLHAAPDDFSTQPDGAAGAVLACGVIARP